LGPENLELLDLHELPALLGRSPETIKKDLRRNPMAVPPRLHMRARDCCAGANAMLQRGVPSRRFATGRRTNSEFGVTPAHICNTMSYKLQTVTNSKKMKQPKSETLSLRVTKRFKGALRVASESERRSQANLLEVLLFDFCDRQGLTLGSDSEQSDGSSAKQT
jgi:hypothetical protein